MLRVYAIYSQTIVMKRILIVMAVVELGLFSAGWAVSTNTSTLVDALFVGEPYISWHRRWPEILNISFFFFLFFWLVLSWQPTRSWVHHLCWAYLRCHVQVNDLLCILGTDSYHGASFGCAGFVPGMEASCLPAKPTVRAAWILHSHPHNPRVHYLFCCVSLSYLPYNHSRNWSL